MSWRRRPSEPDIIGPVSQPEARARNFATIGPPSRLSRRRFVSFAGAVVAGAWLAGCSSADDDTDLELPDISSFAEPPIATSSGGLLEVTLRAEASDVAWRGGTRCGVDPVSWTPDP